MGKVLFVCKANICRSPVMSFVFSTSAGLSTPVEVSSAGTRAVEGSPICDVSRRAIASRRGGRAFAEQHRASIIDPQVIRSQDLILVASREERAAVAIMCPDVRPRVFTVREALALAEAPLTVSDRRSLSQADPGALWAACAALLDGRRGTVDLAPVPGRFPWSMSKDLLDVPDAHQSVRYRHVATVDRLVDVVEDVASALNRLIDGSSTAFV